MQHTLALRDARSLSYTWFGTAASRGGTNRAPSASVGNRTSGSPTIVYLHGFTSSRLEAELVHADALYHGQAVLAVDRPGYGCSSPHPDQTVESTAADVRELLDALELQQVAMMGVSGVPPWQGGENSVFQQLLRRAVPSGQGAPGCAGGSPFACACAALMPERVVALLLLSPLMPTLGREEQLLAGAGNASLRMCHGIQHRPWQVWATLHMLRLIQKVPHGNLLLKAGGFAEVDRRAVDEMPQEAAKLKAAVREGLAQGVSGAMRDLHVFHVAPPSVDLAAIRCKTHVWQGRQDTTTPPAMAQHYAATIPGAQLHMKDEGHLSLGFKHNREILGSIADEASQARGLM